MSSMTGSMELDIQAVLVAETWILRKKNGECMSAQLLTSHLHPQGKLLFLQQSSLSLLTGN